MDKKLLAAAVMGLAAPMLAFENQRNQAPSIDDQFFGPKKKNSGKARSGGNRFYLKYSKKQRIRKIARKSRQYNRRQAKGK